MDQKIILGDAYKLIKDVPSGSVDFVFTDPPKPLRWDKLHWVESELQKRHRHAHAEERRGQRLHAPGARARIEKAWWVRGVVQ